MDLISGYGSSGSESDNAASMPSPAVQPVARRADRRILQAAPAVSATTAGRGTGKATSDSLTLYTGGGGKSSTKKGNKGAMVLMNNPTKAVLYQPVLGPQLDSNTPEFNKSGVHETNVAFDEATFQQERNKFQRTGQASAPDEQGTSVVRTTLGYNKHRLEMFAAKEEELRKRRRPEPTRKEKEPLVYGSDDEVEHGIWAPPSSEERWAAENALSDVAKGGVESSGT